MTDQDQQLPAPGLAAQEVQFTGQRPRPADQPEPDQWASQAIGAGRPAHGGSPFVRKYLGKTISIRFSSGHIERGKLIDIDHAGVFGRLDRGYWADGTPRERAAIPDKQTISINLRRAEVIE